MQFIYPFFLWSFFLLAIPVIIHLFHFRRFKKIYFTNVYLLKEIKEETSSRNKLKNLLVLVSRLLILSMLIFAFAQPVILADNDQESGNNVVVVFIDNSFSMKAIKDEVPLLTLAKDRGKEILSAYSDRDAFLILTDDLEAKHERLVDKKTANSFIDGIHITPEVETIEKIVQVANRIVEAHSNDRKQFFLISDFQENISQFESRIDSSIEMNLIPLRAVQENNVAITDCFFESPVPMKDVNNQLIVKFANYGTSEKEVQFSMIFENQRRPLGTVIVAPKSETYDTVQLSINKTGWFEVLLVIDDYPIEFDDQYFISFEIKNQINILNIFEASSNPYLESAFESLSYYSLSQTQKNAVKYDNFKNQQLIILDDLNDMSSGMTAELQSFVTKGGNILIFPSSNANLEVYNHLLDRLGADQLRQRSDNQKRVSYLNSEEFVFNNVFESTQNNIRLPIVQVSFGFDLTQGRNRDVLLAYRDGSPFLTKYVREKGNIYLCSAPLNRQFNDLVVNAEIFIPMLFKMSISSGIKKPLSYTIGKEEIIEVNSSVNLRNGNYLVSGVDEFIPGTIQKGQYAFIDVHDQVKKADFYDLSFDSKKISSLSFNYDRMESNVSYANLDPLSLSIGYNVNVLDNVALADFSSFLNSKTEGILLWRWCIILALVFLLIETLLLKLWK